jgi:two-component system LytT family response regulator
MVSNPSGTPRLRALVVDDEPLARDNLRLGLAAMPEVEIVRECGDGREAIEAIAELEPDLVFLDIQLPGLDGFRVIETIGPERMPPVVFVTAFDAHAIHAFEVGALDYLLKPFEDARLHEAVRRARSSRADRDPGKFADRLRQLLATVAPDLGRAAVPPPPIVRFVVRQGDRAVPIRATDVDWIDADGNYVLLHVRGEVHRLRISLKTLVDQLDARRFARIHKSTIVNLERVREVQPWFGGDYIAILHSGDKLRVSRTFAPEILRPLQ